MKKKILLSAALAAMSMCTAYSADVTSWPELYTNRNESLIDIINDITAEGGNKVISTNTASAQVIDAHGHAIVGANGYSFSLNNTADATFKNLGSYANGTSGDNTFSYKDLNNTTQYIKINSSVNSFPKYVITRYINNVSLNIENSVFTNNGSRILALSGSNETLNIKNSVFYGNSSTTNGAMIDGKGTINIENSIFQDNHNLNDDGGIYDGTATINIKNSYFINNSSVGFGGVINQYANTLTIENSRFEGNSSAEDGGAICLDGNIDSASIKGSQFINNHNGGSYYDGGAISSAGGYVGIVDNVLFEGNNAISKGGGLYGGMSKKQKAKPAILMKDVVFKNNEASTGGGFYTDASASGRRQNYTYITDSEFTNNLVKATDHYMEFGFPNGGGMTSATGVPMVINNTVFSNNVADPTGPDYSAGGAIYFAGGAAEYPLKVVDSTFTNNSALEGGAIFLENADAAIIAQTKDVLFSGNTASADADDYNGGGDIYFQANSYSATLSLNAAENKKITFNGTIASYDDGGNTSTIDINKSGVTYNTYDGTTEKPVTAGTAGEIIFNNRVGDDTYYFNAINLYGGKLTLGKNDTHLNDNNFYVEGDSTLSTVNGAIGNFAPRAFEINATLDYMLDVDLANTQSDTIAITANTGALRLSSFNVISDSDTPDLKIKYSNTNVGGTVKDGYTITTSTSSYDVTAENDSTGSYIIFSVSEDVGGLPNAIKNGADQYIITDGKDENVTAWASAAGNVIKNDMDINGNGHSIFTENGLDGLVVSADKNVTLRNVENLSGFNNALTNDGGNVSVVDSNITGNTGTADITNNGGTVTINAQSKEITIGSDNTTNALLSDGGTVNVTGSDKVTFNGNVKGSSDAKMNISTDTVFNGDVSDMNVVHSDGSVDVKNLTGGDYTQNDGTLNLKESGNFAPDNFELNNGVVNIPDESAFAPLVNTLNGGSISIVNDKTGELNFNTLNLNNTVNLAVDVDLKNEIMDRISASSVNGSGMIKINQFNLLSDANKSKLSLNFANDKLKDYVSTDITSIEGKIFKYDVEYDNKTGCFNFAGGGGNSDGYSPSVLPTPIAAQLQGALVQLISYDEAFRNMDSYMLMPLSVRRAMKYKNRYAISSSDYVYDDSKDMYDNTSGWVRAQTVFEKVPLKHGPKVGNVAYSTYLGAESELYSVGKGWDVMWGLYAGYNGSHQHYDNVSMYQNGGTLGVLGMAYKGNFFQGLTINTGANAGEAYTSFGHDNFAMLMAGIASKTGYNFEFKEGKFIIQPSMLVSYSFVNTFDYTNSAGVRMTSSPLHAIMLEPNIKLIANIKGGWQPYLSVGMVWNVMDTSHYKANDVSLPDMTVKPYVKYGVGIRKTWGERFVGFFQTYITNGGRNGVGLQLGFRWAIGRDNKSKTKVLDNSAKITVNTNTGSTTNDSKKVIKCLSTPTYIAHK